MMSHMYKLIGMLVIVIVLLGHHSIQAQAMEHMPSHTSHGSCGTQTCDHEMNMEICEKIQSDEMQVSSEFSSLSEYSYFSLIEIETTSLIPQCESDEYERIPLSSNQLARSHLS